METDLSVVIPTRKQKYLKDTLEALTLQDSGGFEVVVVENGIFSGDTVKLTEAYSKNLPVRYLFNPGDGANNARNRGIEKSSGKIVALTDDDCIPNTDWISNVRKAHNLYPHAGVIGGKINLRFLSEEPIWMKGVFRSYLAEISFGESPYEITEDYECLATANFSFRKDVFENVGGFHETFKFANDEFIFLDKVRRAYNPGALFLPDLVITHQIPKGRLNFNYFKTRAYNQGRGDVCLWKERNPNFSEEEMYDVLRENMEGNYWDWESLNALQKTMSPGEFREYEQRFLLSRIEYLNGMKHEIAKLFGGKK